MDESNGGLKGGSKSELPENKEERKFEYTKPVGPSTSSKVENAKPLGQSMDEKDVNTESLSRLKVARNGETKKNQQANGPSKRKKKSRTSRMAKLKGKFSTFGATVKKLWDVWGNFNTKNIQDPHPPREKTLGVPGFDEIACIEAEVPDIMMMDKDRVRTSCKECMKDPPTFPSKDQIKAKLIAADKYYGVKSEKVKMDQWDSILEHEADYYDVDGTVVRPSWRFILERPLVEQYVLMTNYIRKVSVLSELKEDKHPTKYIEEEDFIDDAEYRKFEQKFIKEKRELLKPILKPKTQDMAVQTSSEPPRHSKEDLKESVSELSLYPESEESTNSPEASAVTIVTSRDYTSPLQSDFDGRTTDQRTSCSGGNWWESETRCQPSESFQTSYESINKNTSSGSDSQSVPIHSTPGNISLQPTQGAFSNDSDSQITPRSRGVEPTTHKKPKDSKKVRFSPVLTYYQGPNKNGALYNLPDDEEITTETNQIETDQELVKDPPLQNHTPENPMDGQMDKKNQEQENIPNSIVAGRTKPSKKREMLDKILQVKKPGQIVSVSVPADWSENKILHSKGMMNVVVSRGPAVKQSKKIIFQEYEEIPDVEHSNLQVSTVQDTTDVNIQTTNTTDERSKAVQPIKSYPPKHSIPYLTSRNTSQSKMQSIEDTPPTAPETNYSSSAIPNTHRTKILSGELNHSRWVVHDGTESIGTENHFQSPPYLESTRPVLETPGRGNLSFDNRFLNQASQNRPKAAAPALQQGLQPNNDIQPHVPPTENTPKYHPDFKNTRDTAQKCILSPLNHQSNKPDEKFQNNSEISLSPQQHSTDTEGPSSSSNEHIKLKASPACFFKVATPTDLSKISVDEFYPEVPEIDYELSEISETQAMRAPRVEIVFANQETALRCRQDTEFHKVTRKEENTILQRSIKTDDTCPDRLRGKTSVASAGVQIKIDEGNIVAPEDKRQSKSSNMEGGKPSTRSSSQQSSITQCLTKFSKTAKQSKRGSQDEHKTTKEIQTILETSHEGTEMKQPSKPGAEVNSILKLREFEPKNAWASALPIPDDAQYEKESQKLKILPTVPIEINSNVPTSNKSHDSAHSSKEVEEPPSCEEIVNGETKIDKVSEEEIEKMDRTESLEHSANYDDGDDDTLITIQRQVENLPTDPGDQGKLQGRVKLYMRTLSSLAEETSSVIESTSSSNHEKLIDMPVMVRSVEELKTIFEKKLEASTMSGESGMQVEDSRSDSKKNNELSKGNLENDEASRKLISVETNPQNDGGNKTENENRLQQKLDRNSCSKSQEERPNSEREPNQQPPYVKSHSKSCAAVDDNSVKCADGIQNAKNSDKQPPSLIQEECSVQQLSQIDVIRESEIYSNTSMYFSSSDDRVAKLSKTRTVFQPVMSDDLIKSSCSRDSERTANENPDRPNKSNSGCSKISEFKEKKRPSQLNQDPKEEGQKSKTKHEGDNFPAVKDNQQSPEDSRQKLGMEIEETEELNKLQDDQDLPTGSRANTDQGVFKHTIDPIIKTKSSTDDTSNPSEAKHWLMDVIPILSKSPRYRGFRPHKPVFEKEVTEAEAVKYRQEAVKPVFRFLKRQREMDDNKE